MRGIRAIRVGMFLSGLLATIAGSGCCESCQNLWGTKSAPPATKSETQDDPTLKGWKTWSFEDQPSHLTPEKIHGGIY